MLFPSANFQWNQCIPEKSYWAETKINTITKKEVETGPNSAKILRMITNIKLGLCFAMTYPSANLMKSIHPFKTYWTETNILSQQQKNKSKRAITQPKLCSWLPISNLTCIYNDINFCRIWMKLMHSFRRHRVEMQRVKTTPTPPIPRGMKRINTCSLCVCHATQVTQK